MIDVISDGVGDGEDFNDKMRYGMKGNNISEYALYKNSWTPNSVDSSLDDAFNAGAEIVPSKVHYEVDEYK